jgi:hypothetical protein
MPYEPNEGCRVSIDLRSFNSLEERHALVAPDGYPGQISTVGMYGDLQGIAGRSLEEIEALNLLSLAPPRGEASADRQSA